MRQPLSHSRPLAVCRLCKYSLSNICYGASVCHVTLGMNERQAHDLMLEESRLGVRLTTAEADVETASVKAKHNARRLSELTSKEDTAG